ncbi:MAG: ABC transporter substrate-binding protein, partial [Comamonadaceae bacterium]
PALQQGLLGVRSPAVDALLSRILAATTTDELLPACRALDRVIMHSHYFIPQWSLSAHRLVYNAWRTEHKSPMPPYALAEQWAMFTWWAAKGQLAAPPAKGVAP